MYFFESILARLSKSKYKNNIIIKGGLLISSIIGDDLRTTKDMDATLKSLPLTKEIVKKMFDEILAINNNDYIIFKIQEISDIREKDVYGGFKINILATFETLKIYLTIELTTGDKITPKEITYCYNSIFDNKQIMVLAYTIETIIAEKFQTIISRGIFNTRMKDYYDLYVIIKYEKARINNSILVLAIKNTFSYRNTPLIINEIIRQIEKIKAEKRLHILWENYQNVATYSKGIKFEELLKALDYIVNKILNEEIML